MASSPQSGSYIPEIAPDEVRSALEAMLASEVFGAERPARFLRHLVETTLRGEGHLLKESVLGTDVFERRATWDPRLDPVVRQEAARLRKRIARYYETAGPSKALRIEIPVGTYVPVFKRWPPPEVQDSAPRPPANAVPAPGPRVDRRILGGVVALLLIAVAGAAVWRSRAPVADYENSIVVLPFVNLNPAAADLYFADGLTDEITDELAHVKSIRVVARSSAFQFRGKVLNIRDVGRQLNVAYALEGSVERLGSRVKISAHLERVSNGTHVWSNTYERQAGDLFAMQSELATAIASRLRATVAPIPRKHVASEEAHDLYMQGRYELEQMTPKSVASATATLQRAIDRDPEYAAAYYALGLAKWNQILASDSQQVGESRRESAALFRKALALDPDLSDAHAGLANYAMQYDWNWAGAERELQAGMAAGEPGVAIHNSYAFYLVFRNRFAEADEHIRRSQELDPMGSVSVANRALCWNLQGRFAKSREEFQRMVQRSPNLIPERYMMALTYIEEGHVDQAQPILAELRQRTHVVWLFEAMAAARQGNRAEALRLIAPFEAKYPDTGVANQWFALVYGFLGDEANTVKWLERSADLHEWQVLNLAVHPAYASVRNAPAFRRLVKRIGME
jgi:TolB-like protein